MKSRQLYICLLVASILKGGVNQLTIEETERINTASTTSSTPTTEDDGSSTTSTTPTTELHSSSTPTTEDDSSTTSITSTSEHHLSTTPTIKSNLAVHCNITITDDSGGNKSQPVRCDNNTSTQRTKVPIIDTGSMSKVVYNKFRSISIYIQFVLIILGILANMFNVTVFAQHRMRSVTAIVLMFLSVAELISSVKALIMASCAAVLGSNAFTSEIYWTLFRWVRLYVAAVIIRCSYCFNIFVATERFIAVRFPLRASHILRRRNPIVLCTLTAIIIMIIHIYNPLRMNVVPMKRGRGTMFIIRPSQMYNNNVELFEGLSLGTKILFVFIPQFGCLVMNILMVLALWKHKQRRKNLQKNVNVQNQNVAREVQTTITILVSTFLYVLLSLPLSTTSIVQRIYPEYGTYKREHYLFRFISHLNGLLKLLSLSLNFFVYMCLSANFRETFVSVARSIWSTMCVGRRQAANVGPVRERPM